VGSGEPMRSRVAGRPDELLVQSTRCRLLPRSQAGSVDSVERGCGVRVGVGMAGRRRRGCEGGTDGKAFVEAEVAGEEVVGAGEGIGFGLGSVVERHVVRLSRGDGRTRYPNLLGAGVLKFPPSTPCSDSESAAFQGL